MNNYERLASELAAALWENSTLRHGLHTPVEFRALCETALLERLLSRHQFSRELVSGEVLEESDWVKESYQLEFWHPIEKLYTDTPLVVGSTPMCYHGQCRRPVQS